MNNEVQIKHGNQSNNKKDKRDLSTMVYHLKEGNHEGIVYLNKYIIDKGTMAQIHKMVVHPATSNMRVMPDCHRGSGCCVGYTSQLTNKIVPKFIGGDIGCGMLTYRIPVNYINIGYLPEPDLSKVKIGGYSLSELDVAIRQGIPMGACHNNVQSENMNETMKRKLEPIWNELNQEVYQFASSHFQKYGDSSIFNHMPTYSWDWFVEKTVQLGSDYKYDLQTLQTLGGGNHFIELNYGWDTDDQPMVFITVHSGSRNIGQKICQYHQRKIDDNKYLDRDKLKEIEKKLSRQFRGIQLHQATEQTKEQMRKNCHPDYLENDEAYQYYFDMIFGQKFAQLNRRLMLNYILSIIMGKSSFETLYDEECIIESIHNYIDFTDFIVRKGAIRAHSNEKCIIALNMRDGILLCNGKSNPEWNYSAAHGAGRVINRQEAYNKLKLNDFEKEMKSVYSTSVRMETLDEAPMVYRDVNIMKQALTDTIDINMQLVPLINLKGLT
jgi:tRNA-splicing ligase RtcB